MSFLSNLLGSKKSDDAFQNPLQVDMHSHLIFGVDDGAQTLEDSINLIKKLRDFGYKKLITTPHIMLDFYRNSKDNLLPKLDIIREEIRKQEIDIQIEVAAEYYLDDGFATKLKDRNNLLLIDNKYILVETSYINEPVNFNYIIFDILSMGITPILAHPERYIYMYSKYEKYQEIIERGALFQINLNSLTGYYSKPAQDIAVKLINDGLFHFFGTDCHVEKHCETLISAFKTKTFRKVEESKILNNNLL